MAIGYLKIQARTADGAVPLQGAQIAVLDDQGRGVYDLFTDENGETPTVPLETVSRDFSLEPSYTGMPYVSYNVFAQALGFNSLYLSGVPVFENETAIQPLAFVPMQEMQRSPTVEDIVIDRPAVSMQTARYQEGPGEEPRVLRQVAIPDPITVHLGSPASSAANVQVSFPDYV
ncbi:MAG: carboxypeptidase-like regulatory domain-containing protein, partial [Muribaculaceae bacterium]|nr:carboxypeptidase-like regulatory domain-containing protein [Muribaculaceae bacterium]